MYNVYTIKDTISIPPTHFGEDINKAAKDILRTRYERTLDKKMGIVLALFDVRDVSDGAVLPGDPATHHTVTFDLLTFNLEVGDIVIGEVSELVDFGCFVQILEVAVDGLLHIDRLTDDSYEMESDGHGWVGRRQGRRLRAGGQVKVVVTAVNPIEGLIDLELVEE